MNSMTKLLVAALLAAAAFAQQKATTPDLCVPPPSGTAPALPAHLMTGQGTEYTHFKITTSNPEAQKFFDQGLAQLHSFWAVEAERSFLQATQLDPDAPMPWFGIAMVASGDYRPRHQLEANRGGGDPRGPNQRVLAAAKKAVELAEVPGKATDLEKMYVAAIAARRMPPAGKSADDAYIEALRAINAKYPKEVEARTFLSLHLMRGFDLPDHTPRADSMESVAILRQLLKDAPDHPGVNHYVIHAWEGSSFASDAWPSCKRYAELVPNIPHALHMPGHIYSQTGKLDLAEKYFGMANVNELGYIKADSLYGTGHHGHNTHYLSTAYAFDGQYDKAKQYARSLLEFKENPREKAAVDNAYTAFRQGWFALMRAMVLSQNWDELLDGTSLPVYDRPREQAWRHWAMGVAQAGKGNGSAAAEEAKAMDAALKDYESQVKKQPPAELTAARMELEGHVLFAQGKGDAALKALKHASETQRKIRYSEPPQYPRPVNEALGEIALKAGKTAEAQVAFRTALEDLPGSARSVKGLAATDHKSTGAAADR
jgi:tetratricopeptide (TPR) repeat protein